MSITRGRRGRTASFFASKQSQRSISSVASYAKSDQYFYFFEIDQGIVDIARDMNLINYLGNCQGSYKIIIGDGRLSLASEEDQKYDLILLDAFSSDSIPVHLLTMEALDLYLMKLKPDGLLAFHVSNRYLNLEPLLAGLAQKKGLVCFAKNDSVDEGEKPNFTHMPSHYIVMGNVESVVGSFLSYPNWRKVTAEPGSPVWTDRHSDLIGLIYW